MRVWAAMAILASFLSACAGQIDQSYLVDPRTAVPPDSPNWALAAPTEAEIAATPTRTVSIYASDPASLLAAFDSVALADDRVSRLDGSAPDDLRGYVQRSALIGFPDVVTVVALDLGDDDGAPRSSLVVYSRSIYGYSDLGVNAARVDRWLAALDDAAPLADDAP